MVGHMSVGREKAFRGCRGQRWMSEQGLRDGSDVDGEIARWSVRSCSSLFLAEEWGGGCG